MSDKPCREERAAVDAAGNEMSRLFSGSMWPEPEVTASGERIVRLTPEIEAWMQEAREKYPKAREKWLEELQKFLDCMEPHR